MTSIRPAHQHDAEPVRPRDQAEAAAEAIRALNHATLRFGDSAGYQWPSDVDAVIGQLQLLAERLPQALEQAREWLTEQLLAGRVGHDTPGRKAAFAAATVVGSLNEAETCAHALAGTLAKARRESSHLTGVIDDPAEGGDV
jgi:hypothetical protein